MRNTDIVEAIEKQISRECEKSSMDIGRQDPKDVLWEQLGLSELDILGFSEAMELLEAMVSAQDTEGKTIYICDIVIFQIALCH